MAAAATLTVNGQVRSVSDAEGQCGACTVLVDGKLPPLYRFDQSRRSFLKLLGAGMAILLVARDVLAQAVGIAPAIGNAIFDATGIRLRSLLLAPRGLKV